MRRRWLSVTYPMNRVTWFVFCAYWAVSLIVFDPLNASASSDGMDTIDSLSPSALELDSESRRRPAVRPRLSTPAPGLGTDGTSSVSRWDSGRTTLGWR